VINLNPDWKEHGLQCTSYSAPPRAVSWSTGGLMHRPKSPDSCSRAQGPQGLSPAGTLSSRYSLGVSHTAALNCLPTFFRKLEWYKCWTIATRFTGRAVSGMMYAVTRKTRHLLTTWKSARITLTRHNLLQSVASVCSLPSPMKLFLHLPVSRIIQKLVDKFWWNLLEGGMHYQPASNRF